MPAAVLSVLAIPFMRGHCVPKLASKLDVDKHVSFPLGLCHSPGMSSSKCSAFPPIRSQQSGQRQDRSKSHPPTGCFQRCPWTPLSWGESGGDCKLLLLDRQATLSPNAEIVSCLLFPDILLLHHEDHLHHGPQHLYRSPLCGHCHLGCSQVCRLHQQLPVTPRTKCYFAGIVKQFPGLGTMPMSTFSPNI